MKLSIVVSNKNRMDVNSRATQLFFQSIDWQDEKDIELVIVDGGSSNLESISDMVDNHSFLYGSPKMSVIHHPIGDVFLRSLLSNVGVRHSNGEYILVTDADMIFRRDFTKTIIENACKDCILESRTFHMGEDLTKDIHDGKIDPYANFEDCKVRRNRIGRFSGSPGGCQCMHRDVWSKLRGYNEEYYGWGSEDRDLLKRAKLLGMAEKWVGRDNHSQGMIVHQWHYQDMKRDLAFQEENKKRLERANNPTVNPNSWGGMA